MPTISLSSIFYLVPLYFLVIAPLLRQLNPSQQQQQHQQQLSFLDDASYDDNADEDPIHTLNPDVLSLDDGTPISCPPDSESYRIHLLSRTPLVIYVESFLSPSEADHLTNISLPNYTPSILYSSSTDKEIDTTKRLSDRALLPRDNTVRCIEARAKAFQGWKPHLYIERMWAQRYNVSGHYTHHYDWAGTAKGRGGDRFSTFMVYLGDECKGGGTHFPFLRRPRDRKWCEFIECEGTSGNEDGKGEGEGKGMVKDGVTFRPIKGNAVFWENLKPDGSGWEETWHAAEPVTEGEKVGLNIWSWYQPPRRRG
ncbi:hypothetical protein BJX61DRAFT_525963 [Aspergillus egyptiacus]|nr:hypothetical protein BJX61DRAFT_525963 [Aspergillus egyptiacus]